jgi:hypothetical protein
MFENYRAFCGMAGSAIRPQSCACLHAQARLRESLNAVPDSQPAVLRTSLKRLRHAIQRALVTARVKPRIRVMTSARVTAGRRILSAMCRGVGAWKGIRLFKGKMKVR